MPKPLSIFDFDGTLVKGDTFIDFLNYLAGKRWPLVLLLLPIILIGMAMQVSHRSCTKGLKLILGCLTLGMTEQDFRQLAHSFSQDWMSKHGLNRAIPSVIRELQHEWNAGHRAIIATGSMALWVEPILKNLTQTSPEIIGSTWKPGLFWISLGERCFRSEKLKMIEAHLQDKPSHHRAFGNSLHDVWFMELAHEISIVRPSRGLLKYLSKRQLPFNVMP